MVCPTVAMFCLCLWFAGSIALLKSNFLYNVFSAINSFIALLVNKLLLIIRTIKSFIVLLAIKLLVNAKVDNTPYVLDKYILCDMLSLVGSSLFLPIYNFNLWIYEIEYPGFIQNLACLVASVVFVFIIGCILYNYYYNKTHIYSTFIGFMMRSKKIIIWFFDLSKIKKLMVILGILLALVITMAIITQLRWFFLSLLGISQPNLLQIIGTSMVITVLISYIFNILHCIVREGGSISKLDFSVVSPNMIRSLSVFRFIFLASAITLSFHFQPIHKIMLYLGLLENKGGLEFNFLCKALNIKDLFLNWLKLNYTANQYIFSLDHFKIPSFSNTLINDKLTPTCSEVHFKPIKFIEEIIRSSLHSFFIDNFYNKPCKASEVYYLDMVSYKSCLLVKFDYSTLMFKPLCNLSTTNSLNMQMWYMIYWWGENYNSRILKATSDLTTINSLDMKKSTIVYWPDKHQYIEALVQKFLESVAIPPELLHNPSSKYIAEPSLLVSSYDNAMDKLIRLHALESSNLTVCMMSSGGLNPIRPGLTKVYALYKKLEPVRQYNLGVPKDERIDLYSDYIRIELGIDFTPAELRQLERYLVDYHRDIFKRSEDGRVYHTKDGVCLKIEHLMSIIGQNVLVLSGVLDDNLLATTSAPVPVASNLTTMWPHLNPISFYMIEVPEGFNNLGPPVPALLNEGDGSQYFKYTARWLKHLWGEYAASNPRARAPKFDDLGVTSEVRAKFPREGFLLDKIFNPTQRLNRLFCSGNITENKVEIIYNYKPKPHDLLIWSSFDEIGSQPYPPSALLLMEGDGSSYYKGLARFISHLSNICIINEPGQPVTLKTAGIYEERGMYQVLEGIFPGKYGVPLYRVTLGLLEHIYNHKKQVNVRLNNTPFLG